MTRLRCVLGSGPDLTEMRVVLRSFPGLMFHSVFKCHHRALGAVIGWRSLFPHAPTDNVLHSTAIFAENHLCFTCDQSRVRGGCAGLQGCYCVTPGSAQRVWVSRVFSCSGSQDRGQRAAAWLCACKESRAAPWRSESEALPSAFKIKVKLQTGAVICSVQQLGGGRRTVIPSLKLS